jgi:hypothetical protein
LAEELAVEQSLCDDDVGMVIAALICVDRMIIVVPRRPEDPEDWLAWLGIGPSACSPGFFGGRIR